MIRSFSYALLLTLVTLALGAVPARSQDSPLRGTWSGHWVPASGIRQAVTVRFEIADGALVGEMVNPEALAFDRLEFDSDHLSLVAEASGGESGPVRIEARIEEETRLNGTASFGTDSGELRLTRWTFIPRLQ